MSPYQEFIFYRTYSRWNDELGRRETWEETVDRYMSYMLSEAQNWLTTNEIKELKESIVSMEVMPSMRLLWASGKAVQKSNATAYNCSFIAPTKFQDFGEILYLLTNGCGVGFSCERHVVEQLPEIQEQGGKRTIHTVKDSREGWADALVLGMKTWYNGDDVVFDYSKIRPNGARLKTMGGRASGPEPLKSLLDFTKEKILSRQGHKLRTIDVHDIVCKIGEVVVAGGVRRSSEISLSDLDDIEMRNAKKGAFWETEPQRSKANNSAVYNEKPSLPVFLEEWVSLMKSGTGERGIFNRGGLEDQMPSRREHDSFIFGTNPCGEITLRNKQFCNLTEVIAREDDTKKDLLRKIRLATILGTFQSSLTDFNYLSKEWKENCEDERLLGVSITGQWDCPQVRKPTVLRQLKEHAIDVNREYAKKLNINPSASVTCVKPSGTVSQLVNASSGMHPRHSKYYVRRVRISTNDPLFKMLRDQGVPYTKETGDPYTMVLEFPIEAPSNEGSDLTALEQLEHWKMVKENYTEHNPSTTISVLENEWLEVGNWVFKNWDIIGGLSFLPKDTHIYPLAPYEKITKGAFNTLSRKFPRLDFSKLSEYEKSDNTEGAKELACQGGLCEIV